MATPKVIVLLISCLLLFTIQNAYTQSPYKLSWKTDGLIIGTGIVSAFVSSSIDDSIEEMTLAEINGLNRMDVNAFDRGATKNYSETAARVSDVFLVASAASPFLLLGNKETKSDFGIISVMYLETMLHGVFLPSYGKGLAQRVRPFAYNSKAPLEEKLDSETKRSFFSGHTTWAFSTTVFFASVYSQYHPNSKFKPYVWTGALLAATTVGVMRYSAGAHFPTDILVGAGVGSLVGYLIPKLHETKNKSDLSFTPFVSKNGGLMMVNYSF